MTLLEAASAGVVQGITEFLPVSSSGHLVLLHAFFGFQEPTLLFDLFLHLGTLTAVVILFRKKILHFFTDERKLLGFVVLGTLPTFAIGFLFRKVFEQFFTQPKVVGIGFLVSSLWLFLGERFRPKEGKSLSWWRAILVGVSQGVAIVPGISRSGATIATALLCGLEGRLAVEYSFLLSVPAILGGFGYKLFSGRSSENVSSFLRGEGKALAVGTILAMLVGLWAIRCITQLAAKKRLYFFSLYLLILGAVTVFAV